MKQKRWIPAVVLLLSVIGLGMGLQSPVSALNEPEGGGVTTWQQLVDQECAGKSGGAAERCADSLRLKLKEKCGAPKDTDKYKNCKKAFIAGYGGGTTSPSGGADTSTGCGNVETTYIKCDDNGAGPIVNLILQIVNFLAVGVGIAVVGGITWGGMLYATSNGDSSKAKQGITTIVNSVIGLIVFMFTYALINYLVPGGLFN